MTASGTGPHQSVGRTTTGAAAGQGRAKRARVAGRLDGPHTSAGYSASRRVDLDRIRALVPLTNLLARYGVLDSMKRAGAQLRGPCPIHNGGNPEQFVVNPQSNTWYCFGDCERGGGTLELVSARERVSVPDAAQLIAEWFALSNSPSTQTAATSTRRTPMNGRPSHRAFVVEDRDSDQNEQGGFWTRIGSAWPHKDGKGLNIVLSALPTNGRVVLREYTDDDVKAEEAKRKPAKK